VSSSTTELARGILRLERPDQALAALAALRRRLDALEAVHVRNAREAGLSWGRAARALGVSRQALHKKHSQRLRPRKRVLAPPEPGPRTIVVTGEARRTVRYAREEALALGHFPVGTGHLLLALTRMDGSPAQTALRSAGVAPEAAREQVERLVARITRPGADGVQADSPDGLPVSRAARRALEQSLHEAVRRGDQHLGVEHVLLALLRDERDVGARALAAVGCDAAALEEALARVPVAAGTSD
jgi:hypothetical protein